MAKTHSGGGRTPVNTPVKTGRPAEGINMHEASSRRAYARGTPHSTPVESGGGNGGRPGGVEPRGTVAPAGGNQELGNARAARLGTGVGVGYDVIGKSGLQGQHGPVNPGNPAPAGNVLAPWSGGKR
jgi:hypothetical protein